eukprot:gene26599-32665_t
MPPPLVQRRVCGLSEAVQALTLECEGAVVCIAANRGRAAVTVEVCAKVKVMLVRGGDDGGLLANETEEAERSNAEERSKPKTRAEEGWGNRGGGGVRWPAKWRHFRAVATVPGNGDGRDAALSCPGGHQRLVMMLLPNGMQAEVGSITWSLVGHAGGGAGKDRRQPGSQASTSGEGGDEKGRGRSAQLHQSALADWLRPGIREKASSSAGIFAPVPLIENLWREMPRRERGRPADDDELAEALARSAHEGETGPRGLADADVEDAMLIAALAQSAREAQATRGGDDEDAVLARVLRQSHHGSEQMASWVQDEDTALAAAIAASAQEAGIADPSLQAAVSLMKPAVAASLPRDPLPSPAVARSGHACSRGEEGRSDSQSTAPCSMASEVIVLDADEDDDVGGKDSVSGNTSVEAGATLYLMGLQPTRRGAWCRADRKKSYRLGDIAIFVARLDANGHVAMVAGGALPGAAWRGRCIAVATLDDPTSEYLVVPFNLGGPPSAAETSAAQPFSVRFFSSAPLAVDVSAFHAASHGQAACATLHHGLEGLGQRAESV